MLYQGRVLHRTALSHLDILGCLVIYTWYFLINVLTWWTLLAKAMICLYQMWVFIKVWKKTHRYWDRHKYILNCLDIWSWVIRVTDPEYCLGIMVTDPKLLRAKYRKSQEPAEFIKNVIFSNWQYLKENGAINKAGAKGIALSSRTRLQNKEMHFFLFLLGFK